MQTYLVVYHHLKKRNITSFTDPYRRYTLHSHLDSRKQENRKRHNHIKLCKNHILQNSSSVTCIDPKIYCSQNREEAFRSSPKLGKYAQEKKTEEDLTLAILHLLIGLHVYIGGPLNQLPNYFLTKSTK